MFITEIDYPAVHQGISMSPLSSWALMALLAIAAYCAALLMAGLTEAVSPKQAAGQPSSPARPEAGEPYDWAKDPGSGFTE